MCLGWDYYTRLSRNVTRTANIYCYNLVTFNFQTYSDASNNDRGDQVIISTNRSKDPRGNDQSQASKTRFPSRLTEKET